MTGRAVGVADRDGARSLAAVGERLPSDGDFSRLSAMNHERRGGAVVFGNGSGRASGTARNARRPKAGWMSQGWAWCAGLLLWGAAGLQAETKVFRAGAYALDISPEKFPAHIGGNFLDTQSSKVTDRLHARTVVLDDGETRIALVVIDSCMMPRELIDKGKELARQKTGIAPEHILVSATHTHSAPAPMGMLGTPEDVDYSQLIPGWIAQSIELAVKNLEPARVGWTSTNDFEHTHCRRWIYRSDKMGTDPFGNRNMRANMHPGYENPDALGPSGPVDPAISILAVQAVDGRPIAVLANYSMHYYGSIGISADYYGLFVEKMGRMISPNGEKPAFVGIMSQGTSGDQMWMDYGQPAKNPGLEAYSEAVAKVAYGAYEKILYHDWAPLAMAETKLSLKRRTPDAERLKWARQKVEEMQGRLPKTIPEVYAYEAIYLHDEPVRELKLQAVRIGGLGLAAIPDEVYALTGLKLKAQSPLDTTMVIELANGAEGYIPPPEQHKLGGYTTWPARTAALEPEAETKIVEAELRLLEQVAGKPRREAMEPQGEYAKAVLNSGPRAYWRLDEMTGAEARDTSGNRQGATYEDGIAFYLEGPQGASFSGAGVINRCAHFAGGRLKAQLGKFGSAYSAEFFFWNGFPANVRGLTGHLFARQSRPGGEYERLSIGGTNQAAGMLIFSTSQGTRALAGGTGIKTRSWNHVVVVREGKKVEVYLNGTREISGEVDAATKGGSWVYFGGGEEKPDSLEGKLDEVAIYDRALSADEIARHEKLSGLAALREEEARRSRPMVEGLPLPQQYVKGMVESKPLAFWRMNQVEGIKILDATENKNHAWKEESVAIAGKEFSGNGAARFNGDRITSRLKALSNDYSVQFWFWNEMPNESRAVTGYLFSRGLDRAEGAPGEHLGIGGSYEGQSGRLIVFNGNRLNNVVAGVTVLEPRTWHHVALVRVGSNVKVYLDGDPSPEIDGKLAQGFVEGEEQIFVGGRSDNFANFKGRIDEVAVYRRALTAGEIAAMYKLSGQAPPPKPAPLRPEPARSAADSLKAIHLKSGFDIEQVAVEPLVMSPVAIDWGADGRLWVVEMADYPMGMDGKMKGGGRVRVLEDKDGDGVFDKSTVYLDGLNFPNGIATWRDGILVTAAPEIFLAGGDAGSGVSRRTLLTGFKEGNLQLRVNGLRWGLDNWIYCANGWSSGLVESASGGPKVDMGGRDIRFKPDEGVVQAESGVSQFGRERDDWGNWFGVDNSHPLFHYVLSDHYTARNPHFAPPEAKVQVIVPTNPKVYPARAPEKRYHSFEQSGHFTSACAPMIYRDEVLFGPGREEHMFVCEPFHNLVHHEILSENGVSFSARRAMDEQESEFLTSDDRWFRPVMARLGPDGALWVVDMYRFMIEHPDWLPPGGKSELEPFYRHGENQGRIYRIFPKGKRPGPLPRLDKMNVEQLVATLESSNGWQRDKAQQLLIWKADRAAVPLLQKMATREGNSLGRLHALCTLDGMGALAAELVAKALGDIDERVRREAVRLSESFAKKNPELIAELSKRLDDSSPKVRLQLACTLGEFDKLEAGALLGRLLVRNYENRYIVVGALSSATKHCAALDEAVAAAPMAAVNALAEDLLNVSLALGEREGVRKLLLRILSDANGRASTDQMRILGRFIDGLAGRKSAFVDFAGHGDEAAKAGNLFAAARKIAMAAEESAERRSAAIGLLGRDPGARVEDLQLMKQLLSPRVPGEIQKAVVKSLANWGDPSVPQQFADAWPGQLPDVRGAMLDEFLGREAWTLTLLQLMEGGKIEARELDAPRRDRLLKHNSERVRDVAQKVLGATVNPARQKVVEEYRPALALQADAGKGSEVFARLCASCHKLDNIGREVGPDLRAVGNRSSEILLTSILDPGSAVDPRYLAYSCKLANDEEVYGIIVGESASSITMKSADGNTRSILRTEIGSLTSAKISLMPEGLESGMTPQELADLIQFLQKL